MAAPKNIRDLTREHRHVRLVPGLHGANPQSIRQIANLATFVSTSRRIQDLQLLEKLARTLHDVTNEEVLLIRMLPNEAGQPANEWSPLNSVPFDRFAFAGRLQSVTDGVKRLFLRVGSEAGDRRYVAAVLGHCARFFKHVLVHAEPDAGREPVTECVRRARLAYALVGQDTDSFARYREYNAWLTRNEKVRRTYLKPVLCLGPDELPQAQEDLRPALGTTVHLYLRDCPNGGCASRIQSALSSPGGLHFDLRRWAREIGRCRIGLAMSSGGAKGFAHIGVLQVLEDHGIEIDLIAGSSMGAYIGSLWAAGHTTAFIRDKAMELQGRWGWWKLIDPVLLPRRGFIAGNKIRKLLMESIGDAQFCDLVRPLKVVTTNLETLEREVFDAGDVAAAVQASAAIPGVCNPVEINGEFYVDGGVVDPLPVKLLREKGIERVIAVNTVPTSDLMRRTRELEHIRARRLGARPWWKRFVERQFNYCANGNIIDIIQQSFTGAQIPNAEEACRCADVVIRPINLDGSWHDFHRPRKYIALGRRTALEHLSELKALTRPREKHHEYQGPHYPMATAA
jgi:NTE family protein